MYIYIYVYIYTYIHIEVFWWAETLLSLFFPVEIPQAWPPGFDNVSNVSHSNRNNRADANSITRHINPPLVIIHRGGVSLL